MSVSNCAGDGLDGRLVAADAVRVRAVAPPAIIATNTATGTVQRSAGRDVKIGIGYTSYGPCCSGPTERWLRVARLR
jgi:hypothetical protein